jgi:hypothetical protein
MHLNLNPRIADQPHEPSVSGHIAGVPMNLRRVLASESPGEAGLKLTMFGSGEMGRRPVISTSWLTDHEARPLVHDFRLHTMYGLEDLSRMRESLGLDPITPQQFRRPGRPRRMSRENVAGLHLALSSDPTAQGGGPLDRNTWGLMQDAMLDQGKEHAARLAQLIANARQQRSLSHYVDPAMAQRYRQWRDSRGQANPAFGIRPPPPSPIMIAHTLEHDPQGPETGTCPRMANRST